MRPCTLVLLALLPVVAVSQSTNDPFGSLVVNSTPGAPAIVNVPTPGTLVLEFGGEPDQPFIFVAASALDVGALVIAPGLSYDLGSNAEIVMDGLSPVTLFDSLANTGPSGLATFNIPVPPGLTNTFALQAIMIAPSAPPLGIAFSAATQVNFVPGP